MSDQVVRNIAWEVIPDMAEMVVRERIRELESQGVGKKVAADMFGLALRSYQLKVQRLQESASETGVTLWSDAYEREGGDLFALSTRNLNDPLFGDRITDFAAGDDRIQVHVHPDERSGGFLALGLALGTGTPVVVATTSGTAPHESCSSTRLSPSSSRPRRSR